jgi:hypothetical protein
MALLMMVLHVENVNKIIKIKLALVIAYNLGSFLCI